MNINEKIEKQFSAGFSQDQIVDNLLIDGYSIEEINIQFETVNKKIKAGKSAKIRNIAFGCLFVLLVIIRASVFSSTSPALGIISIFTGLFLALYFFTK